MSKKNTTKRKKNIKKKKLLHVDSINVKQKKGCLSHRQ